ncbi:hypothetical protein ES703_15028 [subsurface metagenome]
MTLHNIYRSTDSSSPSESNSQKDLAPPNENTTNPKAVAHYNALPRYLKRIYYKKGIREVEGYGVQAKRRILTVGLFHKRHDDICHSLSSFGLAIRQRDAILKLLELYCHYGKVYPKAEQVADDEYISKRTFWYAIGKLRSIGLIRVVNRYFNHRQISNLYRLDKLVVMIARILAEHGQQFNDFATKLLTFFNSFWQDIGIAEFNLSELAPIKLKKVGGW